MAPLSRNSIARRSPLMFTVTRSQESVCQADDYPGYRMALRTSTLPLSYNRSSLIAVTLRHFYCAPLPVKFTGSSTVRINAIVAQLEAAAEIHWLWP